MSGKMERSIAILKILINAEGIVSSDTLSKELNVSDRTLRDDITKCKQAFTTHGIQLHSKHGAGYYLEIIDEGKYYTYIQNLMKEEYHEQRLLPVYPEDRINYLIKLFLTSDEYIKIDDVADEIFVSRSTLTNDLKEVRERLKYFHLELESKPAYGSRISGSEFHRRSCIAQYFFHTETIDDIFMRKSDMNKEQLQIRDILYDTMYELDFKLTDIGFQNLIIHISIALLRIRENTLTKDTNSYEELMQEKEYEIAKKLAKKIEDAFQVSLPQQEIFYITIHLLGKKNMQYQNNFIITGEIESLLATIFAQIKEYYGMDLSSDFELYTLLALHFQPMLNRLCYQLPIQNPLLEQIKKENSLAFEVAVLSARVIEQACQCEMDESEIGYLALHFALAIERIHEQVPQKNIIIVCASGAGSSQILLYKVKQRFGKYLGKVKVTELYEVEKIDQDAYDFILSTVLVPFVTKIPVIQVQYFLDGKDIANVSDAFVQAASTMDFVDQYFDERLFFTDIAGKTKEEVIQELCRKTTALKKLPIEFVDSVLEREAFSVTEFGDGVAMPHPMKPMSEETFVSVALLPKAIRWQKQMVKYVFLLCIKKDSTEALGLFHETLSSLVMDKSMIQQFEKEPTMACLKRVLKQIAEKEKENDIDTLFV